MVLAEPLSGSAVITVLNVAEAFVAGTSAFVASCVHSACARREANDAALAVVFGTVEAKRFHGLSVLARMFVSANTANGEDVEIVVERQFEEGQQLFIPFRHLGFVPRRLGGLDSGFEVLHRGKVLPDHDGKVGKASGVFEDTPAFQIDPTVLAVKGLVALLHRIIHFYSREGETN